MNDGDRDGERERGGEKWNERNRDGRRKRDEKERGGG